METQTLVQEISEDLTKCTEGELERGIQCLLVLDPKIVISIHDLKNIFFAAIDLKRKQYL